jgi:GntR family transcriptional regulator
VPENLPIALRSGSGAPYYRQIVDQVTDLVMTGKLEPGAQIPSVRELAALLTVSLITTRRAYAELEAAGLVSRHRGQGTFVAARPRIAALRKLQGEVTGELRASLRRALQLGIGPGTLHGLVDELSADLAKEDFDDDDD